MKTKIGNKLILGFAFCVVLSIIIGIVAIVNIVRIRGNSDKIDICRKIEIELLECRRQEKNILLFSLDGKFEKVLKEGEKGYFVKIKEHLDNLRNLLEQGKINASPDTARQFNLAGEGLEIYMNFLKNIKINFRERSGIMLNIEREFDSFEKFASTNLNILNETSELHTQLQNYIVYRNEEYLNGMNKQLKAWSYTFNDKNSTAFIEGFSTLVKYLVENYDVIERNVFDMRGTAREMQHIITIITKDLVQDMKAIGKSTLNTVAIVVVLSIIFGAFVSIVLPQSITNPINDLLLATAVVAKGDLSKKIFIKSNDEIGKLAEAFNKMTNDLQNITVSKIYLNKIINSMIDTMIVVDLKGKIREVNKATSEVLGYKEEEMLGKSVSQLFKEDDYFISKDKFRTLVEKGNLNCKKIYLSKDKEKIPVLFSCSAIRNSKGEIIEIVGVGKDLRDMESLQERLAHSEHLAAMGKVSGIIGHEFRNQLSVMRNSIYFLKTRYQGDDRGIKKHLDMLEEKAVETDRIIENILIFAKTKKPKFKDLNVRDVLLNSIDKIQIPTRVKVLKYLDKDLPEIWGDEIQLTRLFVNIILNAVQAMDGEGKFTVKAAKEGYFINILFEDTGSGIEDEDMVVVFEPFFSTKARGAGLGLSISKTIIEAHGGSIDIKSEVEKGTTLTVKLPVKGFNDE